MYFFKFFARLASSLIVMVFINVLLPTETAHAMQLSGPVYLGSIMSKGGPYGASREVRPTSLKGSYYDFGIDENNLIRVFVNPTRIGSTHDPSNAQTFEGGGWVEFFEIYGDNGMHVYAIKGQGSDGVFTVTIVGKDKNGRFIKYVDYYNGFKKMHNESNFYGALGNVCNIRTEGDTIVIDAGVRTKSPRESNRDWQFRLKWDEKAQWFGIQYLDK